MNADNELIDDFYVSHGGNLTNKTNLCFYESDWNMLMPVVQKISKLHSEKFHYEPKDMAKGIYPNDNEYIEVICLPLSTPINEVVKAVIKFIEWYNLQPNDTIVNGDKT